MSLHRNPEFIRNLWLEITPQRLIAMPVILGLIFFVCYAADEPALRVSQAALVLFVIITLAWGAKLAGDSLSEEFVQGTWDTQRLSGLDAWRMTTGKLFGGPIFAWYGGLICVVVYLLASPSDELGTSVRVMLIAIGSSVTLHAMALLSSLILWRKQPQRLQRPRSRAAGLILLFVLGPQILFGLVRDRELDDVNWYGYGIPGDDFALFCVGLALFWSVLGLYRTMREELAFNDPPLVWIAFLLFLFGFSGGWIYGVAPDKHWVPDLPVHALMHLVICAALAGLATYGLVFSERKDWLRLRRMSAHWHAGDRRRAFALMPKWMASMMVCVLVVLILSVATLLSLATMNAIAWVCVFLALLCFLIRDTALVLALNFVRDQRRADTAAALYLLLLYVLLPALLAALNLQIAWAAVLPPLVYEQPPWLIAGLLQTAAALDFALRRWRQLPI